MAFEAYKRLVILILILSPKPTLAKDSLRLAEKSIYNFLRDSSENRIGFSCGFSSHEPNNLCIQALITGSRYDLIQKLLYSDIPATQYLSAQISLIANKKKSLDMDTSTLSKILEINNSEQMVSLCNGCFISTTSLKVLFDKRNKHPVKKQMNNWIRDQIKHQTK